MPNAALLLHKTIKMRIKQLIGVMAIAVVLAACGEGENKGQNIGDSLAVDPTTAQPITTQPDTVGPDAADTTVQRP